MSSAQHQKKRKRQKEDKTKEPTQKISVNMTLTEAMTIMSEGNPGAMCVMSSMIEHVPTIDPQCPHPILAIGVLDACGIYGSDIWVLYKDICGESIVNMLAVLRHKQLGLSGREDMFVKRDMGIIMKEVQDVLLMFNRQEA